MDIESEHLGIPETEYKCNVRLPSLEFQRIIRGKRKWRNVTDPRDVIKVKSNRETIIQINFYHLVVGRYSESRLSGTAKTESENLLSGLYTAFCAPRQQSTSYHLSYWTLETDLGVLGDTCSIAVTKEGIKFSSSGDLGTGSIMLKHNTGKTCAN